MYPLPASVDEQRALCLRLAERFPAVGVEQLLWFMLNRFDYWMVRELSNPRKGVEPCPPSQPSSVPSG